MPLYNTYVGLLFFLFTLFVNRHLSYTTAFP